MLTNSKLHIMYITSHTYISDSIYLTPFIEKKVFKLHIS